MAKEPVQEVPMDEPFVSLESFAQANARKYGIELMGGFYHTQEVARHYADTPSNWHALIDAYRNREVK